MALPVLKCPFLSQLTLQQVRASAPHILNAGVDSCPIFSQFARKISTVQVPHTGNVSSMPPPPMTMDEIKAVHEKVFEQNNQQRLSDKIKRPMAAFQTAMNGTKPNPYGDGKTKVIQFFH